MNYNKLIEDFKYYKILINNIQLIIIYNIVIFINSYFQQQLTQAAYSYITHFHIA